MQCTDYLCARNYRWVCLWQSKYRVVFVAAYDIYVLWYVSINLMLIIFYLFRPCWQSLCWSWPLSFTWVNRDSPLRYSVYKIIMPPFEKGGAYCFAHVGRSGGRSVCMSVSLNFVQLITLERFAPEASNLIGR